MVSKLETKAVQLFCQCTYHWSMFGSSLCFNNITNQISSKFICFFPSINSEVEITSLYTMWFEYFRTGGTCILKQMNIQHI
jgi:hypothetical protein